MKIHSKTKGYVDWKRFKDTEHKTNGPKNINKYHVWALDVIVIYEICADGDSTLFKFKITIKCISTAARF
jgi:hypothetical protein